MERPALKRLIADIQQKTIDISLLYWVLIPLASVSIYLARSVTRTNKTLQNQLLQVETLSEKVWKSAG